MGWSINFQTVMSWMWIPNPVRGVSWRISGLTVIWEVAALSVDWDAHIVDIGEERKCDGFDGQDLFPKGG